MIRSDYCGSVVVVVVVFVAVALLFSWSLLLFLGLLSFVKFFVVFLVQSRNRSVTWFVGLDTQINKYSAILLIRLDKIRLQT